MACKNGHPSEQHLSRLSKFLNFHVDKNKLECCDIYVIALSNVNNPFI